MEDVQKNENGTTAQQADGKPKKENKPKRELTPQQVQQRRKMIVFPLMFLAFAGCMYLIFAPSGKEDVNVESVGGFNADIPLPAEDGIIADKQTAYEQAMMSRKRQDRIQKIFDISKLIVCIVGGVIAVIMCVQLYLELCNTYMSVPFKVITFVLGLILVVSILRIIVCNETK